MFSALRCAVGILRPVEIEASRQIAHVIEASGNTLHVGEAEFCAQLDQAVEHVRDMTVEAATELGMRVSITGYQLHEHLNSLHVMGRKRARNVLENTLLVSVNPSPTEFSFVTGLKGHPLRRTVIAFTSAETLMDMSLLLGTAQTPVFGSGEEGTIHTVPRIFSVYIPPNEDQAADRFQQNKTVVSSALTYPHIDLQAKERTDYTALRKTDGDCPESQPEYRGYFVEPHTDKRGRAGHAA